MKAWGPMDTGALGAGKVKSSRSLASMLWKSVSQIAQPPPMYANSPIVTPFTATMQVLEIAADSPIRNTPSCPTHIAVRRPPPT